MVRAEEDKAGDKAYRISNLRDNPINRKVKKIKESSDGYKFKRRANILNNLRYFKNLRYLFDNPNNSKETKEKEDKYGGGGVVRGKIRGIEAKIELTRTNPGYLSIKTNGETSEEESEGYLYTAHNKILDDIISGRVKLS